jgi:putative spermidine/putrescine transport system ATP-binding protein
MSSSGGRLVITGLGKSYGEVLALAPSSLQIEAGEFFSIIGPSGSGKTTLLGLIAGFLAPSSGRIEIDGVDVVHVPPYRRQIGMVFQGYALFPHMNVFENVAFPLRLRRFPQAEIRQRVGRMLEMVRLADAGPRAVSQLSGGQQQRIALARAAIYDPRILLMDEPLGALDKNLREEMQYEIKQFHQRIGATIVYVTHDQGEATALSDRIAVMNKGRIVQVGPPRGLYDGPQTAFVASFLGEANLFALDWVRPVHADDLVEVGTRSGATLRAVCESASRADRDWLACVRSEAIRLAPDGGNAPPSDNHVVGTVVDTVYGAGSTRYWVELDPATRIMVREPARRQSASVERGRQVSLTWAAKDMILIPPE